VPHFLHLGFSRIMDWAFIKNRIVDWALLLVIQAVIIRYESNTINLVVLSLKGQKNVAAQKLS